jgi:hypothetical protein
VPSCINPDHLFLGTPAENAADRDAKKRHRACRGEASGRAKLKESDIIDIRNDQRALEAIAKVYGIDRRQVGRIKTGLSWSHVGGI